jgi:hypothetical protein
VESQFWLYAARWRVIRRYPAYVGGMNGLAARTNIFAGFAGACFGGGGSKRAAGGRAICGQRVVRDQGQAAPGSRGRDYATSAEAACGAQAEAFA